MAEAVRPGIDEGNLSRHEETHCGCLREPGGSGDERGPRIRVVQLLRLL
jgi:hypothetical protein